MPAFLLQGIWKLREGNIWYYMAKDIFIVQYKIFIISYSRTDVLKMKKHNVFYLLAEFSVQNGIHCTSRHDFIILTFNWQSYQLRLSFYPTEVL